MSTLVATILLVVFVALVVTAVVRAGRGGLHPA